MSSWVERLEVGWVDSDSVSPRQRAYPETGRVRGSEFSFRNFVGDES